MHRRWQGRAGEKLTSESPMRSFAGGFSRFPGGLRKPGERGDEQELGLQHKGNERRGREGERLPCAYVITQVESGGK